jgi:putative ABC transport system permease protein
LIDRYPETDKGYGIRLTRVSEDVVSGYSGTVWLLGAAVAILLLIAAANVANLLFVRGLERRRELAIRAAIGATRSRLIAQLLRETGVLSFLGGVAGLALAFGSVEIIKQLSPPEIYRSSRGAGGSAGAAVCSWGNCSGCVYLRGSTGV